ncbi:hypothetical protein B9Z55_027998 [Caenorhabditis nigoni]|uniref:Uncharacterized protein n=1 Tax=Caenorhabditis nigoni TaxID=1611254 RepID=A0A2G5SDL3_9PELO|nr:hypothetical protein B9Z55_027998 [Caenorhabditis nigoni]
MILGSSPSSSSSASRSSFTLVSAQPSSSGYGLNFGRGTWAHPPFSSFPIFGQSSDLGAPWFSASHPPPAAPHNSEVNIESDYENFLSADEDSEEERPVLKSPESSESVFANINKTDNFFDKVSGFYRQNINPIVHPTATRQNSAVWFFVRFSPDKTCYSFEGGDGRGGRWWRSWRSRRSRSGGSTKLAMTRSLISKKKDQLSICLRMSSFWRRQNQCIQRVPTYFSFQGATEVAREKFPTPNIQDCKDFSVYLFNENGPEQLPQLKKPLVSAYNFYRVQSVFTLQMRNLNLQPKYKVQQNLPPSAPEAPGPSIPEDGDQNADTMEQDVQDKQNLPGPGPATLQMRNLNLQPDVSMEED